MEGVCYSTNKNLSFDGILNQYLIYFLIKHYYCSLTPYQLNLLFCIFFLFSSTTTEDFLLFSYFNFIIPFKYQKISQNLEYFSNRIG